MSNHLDLTFDTPEPIELYVENGRGTVDVTATDTTETTVRITGERAEEFDVRDLGDRIAIIAPRGSGGFFGKDPAPRDRRRGAGRQRPDRQGRQQRRRHPRSLRRHPDRLRLG